MDRKTFKKTKMKNIFFITPALIAPFAPCGTEALIPDTKQHHHPPTQTHTHTKPLPVPAAAFGSSTVAECWWLRASVWIHSRAQHDLLTSQSLDERWTVDDCFLRCPRLDWKMGHTGYKGQSQFESRRCTSGGVVFTSMTGESYRRQLRSLLLHLYIFWALITSLRCWCLLWRQLIFLNFVLITKAVYIAVDQNLFSLIPCILNGLTHW